VIDPEFAEERPVVTTKTLRQFAALIVLFLGALVAWHRLGGNPRTSDPALLVLAAAAGILGLLRPETFRPLFSGLLFVTAPIGRIVSAAVLLMLFYVVFTPLGLVQRLAGRDALAVGRPSRASHWTPKAKPSDLRDYTRQS
jgi:hypothetical protein